MDRCELACVSGVLWCASRAGMECSRAAQASASVLGYLTLTGEVPAAESCWKDADTNTGVRLRAVFAQSSHSRFAPPWTRARRWAAKLQQPVDRTGLRA